MAIHARQEQTQSQKLQQGQYLSALQVLTVKLLELPTQEFEERVHAELLDNPALEAGEDPTADADKQEREADEYREEEGDVDLSLGDYRTEDDIPDYKLQENNRSREDRAEDIPFSDSVSFYETLLEQLAVQNLNEQQMRIGDYLIGSLDDDGLLRKSTESITDELLIYQGIETTNEEVEEVLKVIQDFDPAGIGARTLQECLLLQIQRKPASELTRIEYAIIHQHLEDFTRKHKDRIIQALGITEALYAEAVAELVKLNPRPGNALGEAMGKNLQQITPDFMVEADDGGRLTLTLNGRNVPELHLSREFKELLDEHTRNKANQSRDSKEALLFLKQKLDAAQGFISAVQQRQQTLLRTMQAIMQWQEAFFQQGDEAVLRPMILKDIAEQTGLDISTVSRVSNSKYVQTNFGIYPLKYFFNDRYTTDTGEELSTKHIKSLLKECIDAEDKHHPLTDDELAELLAQKGFNIARRTIAKYRQQMNIPIARLRR